MEAIEENNGRPGCLDCDGFHAKRHLAARSIAAAAFYLAAEYAAVIEDEADSPDVPEAHRKNEKNSLKSLFYLSNQS